MRGRFRTVVHGAAGSGEAKPSAPGRRWLGNFVTFALVVAAAVILLRRFGYL